MTVSEEVRSANTKREGWLLKGSDIVNGVTCRRYGVLSKDSFETYRQESDPKPSSVWPLHPKCEVTPLDRKELTIRAKGRSTIVALVAGKYEKLDGYSFSVLWPASHATKTSRVVLGFEEETTAARWQTCFLEAIQNLGVIPRSEYKPIARSTSETVVSTELENPELFCDLRLDKVAERSLPLPILPIDSDAETSMRGESVKEAAPKTFQPTRDLRVASSSTCTTSDIHDRHPQTQGANSGNESECYWCPWKHVNGVAVYREDVGNGRDGAFMVSTIVRAPPSMCFKALMSRSATRSNLTSGFFDMEVLEELADDMQIVHAQIEATGWAGRMLAPREITAERSWRLEEEDGTYVVLLQSTNKRVVNSEQDKPGGFLGWAYSPVEAQVQAAGFTIAPLQEKYCPDPTKSPESLVTMVLKIDLGGICSSNSWLGSASSILGIREAWIESMLMTVVCLKDRVEQSRFVTLPFTIGSSMGGSQQPHQETSTQAGREFDQSDAKPTPESNSTLDHKEDHQSESAPGSPVHQGRRQNWESGTLSQRYYSCPGAAGFKLRGKNYLQDRKKILAPEPEFDLKSVDLVKLDKPTPHVSRYLESVRCSTAGFTYVVQIMVPGPPHLGLVMAWSSKDDASMNRNETSSDGSPIDSGLDSELTPFEVALMRFVSGDDGFRNDTFKLIPHIVKGSWIIRQSVGSTPVLLGNKLKQYYHRGPRYIEVDIDVGSSYTAASVVGLVSGATRSLCVDLAILTEGNSVETLPEALLGTVRFDRLDLTEAVYLDTSKEIEPREVSTPKKSLPPSQDGAKEKKDEEMASPKKDG
ncbi:hypothetical protein BSKO_04406 [Bryopsis sp. KO-2023]|nr:hypothetical protein BSKO_04406 [Bryopsis sp. KO-2023]